MKYKVFFFISTITSNFLISLTGAMSAACLPVSAANDFGVGSKWGMLRIASLDRSENEVDVSIIGGNATFDPQYKFIVSLQSYSNKKYFHFCGGSLINDQQVVTAAHCVRYGFPARVVLNVTSLSDTEKFVAGVSEVVIHQNYSPQTNDVAVITLDRPIPASIPRIKIVNNLPRVGATLGVIGWGYTQEGSGKTVNQLQLVRVPMVSRTNCRKSYSEIDASKVCAGSEGKDSCQGDSGGPLFIGTKNGNRLVGIVSYGKGCGRLGYYGVYTNAVYFRSFIESQPIRLCNPT